MKHLAKEQRYQIKAYLNCGKSKLFIAQALNVINLIIKLQKIEKMSKKLKSLRETIAK